MPVRPTPAPAPVSPPIVHYRAKVDPSFTQDATDPLAVTYSYSADATSTLNAVTTDLAAAGQLPAGVLNFYSQQQPGSGPESLYCSMNVGGAATGGGCPITYGATGVYAVTTQYIPDGVSATTQTDLVTISPFSTTTTLTVTQTGCDSGSPPGYSLPGPYCVYTLTNNAMDQNGGQVGPEVMLIAAPDTGQQAQAAMVAANDSVTVYVTSSWVLASNSRFNLGSGTWNVASWSLSESYAGTTGWGGSLSLVQTVTP